MSPRTESAHAAALVAALVFGTSTPPLSAGTPRGDADPSSVQDELSREPSEPSLVLILRPGMRKDSSEYALFGDGRLRITKFRDSERTLVYAAFEYRLDELEMSDLNTLIVGGGLSRYDSAAIQQAEAALRPRPSLDDAGLVSFRLRITGRGPDDQNTGQIRIVSFDLPEPAPLAQAYPEIREYRAANDLLRFLHTFRTDVVRIDGNRP